MRVRHRFESRHVSVAVERLLAAVAASYGLTA